jgi:hypothetical protein
VRPLPSLSRLQHRSMVAQKRLQRLAEVMDERKPIDDVHRVRCSPANIVGVALAAIMTHRRDGRMLGQPGRQERCRSPAGLRSAEWCCGRMARRVRPALCNDTACTGGLAAHELPHGELEVNAARAPGEVRPLALIAAMDGRRRHGTAQAAPRRCRRRELEPYGCLLNGDVHAAELTGGWEEFGNR